MEIFTDTDVKKVLEFMQTEIEAEKLLWVSGAVAVVAPALWGNKPPLSLRPGHVRGQQSTATELALVRECVDGGSVAEVDTR